MIAYFYFDVFQLLQGGSDQMLRSLHLQKSLSSYNYIHVGAQLKVSVSFLRWFRYRIKESEGTLINYRFQPATLRQMNDSFILFLKFSRTETQCIIDATTLLNNPLLYFITIWQERSFSLLILWGFLFLIFNPIPFILTL